MITRRAATLAIGGAVGATIAGARVRPRAAAAVGPTRDRGLVQLADGLPTRLTRHLDPDGDGLVPRMDTIALWARPQLRLGRRMPWLWARMLTRHRVGVDFVSDIAPTWAGRTVLDVVDAYVGGHGMAGPIRRPAVGAGIDQGANLFLWAEATLIPSVFTAGSPVKVVDDAWRTVQLTIPAGDATDTALLHFADDDHPSRFSALRYKGAGGRLVWWHVDMRRWWLTDGIMLPGRIDVTWEDEGRPWFRMDVDGFAANVDVGHRLDAVAATIRTVRGQRGLPG
ncbi:DUF6544 family protein [Phytoactinopolyspora halotolerans]|uniref:Uncharacterized protein n=1 Tax=Phytoactinopolyspora halotolerans TaxID=1981512 RepID=A0A6L9S768_9ACTN|nr:DUF6544 family protein [Phytoactinopolyspora halotolerans]NEE00601.1 hypothetical protein [Phytoactinopolyspora halotolerans]